MTKDLKVVQAITRKLLSENRPLDGINESGKTAIDLAEENGTLDIFYWLKNPDINLYKKKDVIGEFYKNMRKEGQNTDCICLLFDKGTKDIVVQLKYPHESFGGWRIFEYCFNKVGAKRIFIPMKLRNKDLLYLFLSFLNLFKALFFKVLKKYPWKMYKESSNHSDIVLYNCLMDKESSLRFLSRCKNKKETFYVSLIKICNDVLKDNLLTENIDTEWLMTMPNPYKEENIPLHYNDFAFLPFKINADQDTVALTQLVKSQLKNLSYLRVFWEMKMFNLLYKFVPQLIRAKMRNGESRFGTFSFFGRNRYSQNLGILGLTNANCFSAVTIVSAMEQEQIRITMDIHPSYIKDRTVILDILNQIKTKVEKYE